MTRLRFMPRSLKFFSGKNPEEIQGAGSNQRPGRGGAIFFHPDCTVGAGISPVRCRPGWSLGAD
jgi:hypothetical protein